MTVLISHSESNYLHSRCRLSVGLENGSSSSGTLQPPLSGWKRAQRKKVVGGLMFTSTGLTFTMNHLTNVLLAPNENKGTLLISYNVCPLQSEYCNKDGSISSMSGLVSCSREGKWNSFVSAGTIIKNNVSWQTNIIVHYTLQRYIITAGMCLHKSHPFMKKIIT